MKNEVVLLALELLKLHEWADTQLAQRKLPTRNELGDLSGWEFDKTFFYNKGIRYIGLGMYHNLYYNKPEWKEAYDWLCEIGLLERCPSHNNQFKYVRKDISDLFKDDTNVPSVPIYQKEDYDKYILSPEWRKKAAERLNLDNGKCQDCGKDAQCVHHLNYDHLFNEQMDDLISLCEDCHSRRHNRG